jgi:hypothetical protein
MIYNKIPIGFDQANPGDKNPLIKVPNKFLGGFKIYPTLTAMFDEETEFLVVDNTFAVVKDKGNGKPGMYVLTSLPGAPPTTTPYTTASNWTLADLNDFVNGLTPKGTFNAGTYDPASHVGDSVANVGEFYVVINADTPVVITNAAIFGGVATTVDTGDWILGNGTSFEVIPTQTPSLAQIRASDAAFSSRIAEIIDGGIPSHNQAATTITTSKLVGATTYTDIEALLAVIMYTSQLATTGNPATEQSKVWTYSQLSAIFKDEAAIQTLINSSIAAILTGSSEAIGDATSTDLVTVAFASFNFYNKQEIEDRITEAITVASGTTLEDEGIAVNARGVYNFIGEGSTLLDDPGAELTKIYIPGFKYAVSAGTSTVFTLTLPEGMATTALVNGMPITFKAHAASGTTPTINIDSLGAKAIVNSQGTALRINDFVAGELITVAYDGTSFRTLGGVGGSTVGAASSTDNALVRFDGTTGKVIQSSGVIIDDSNNITGVNDLTVNGNLIVSGNTVQVDSQITTTDAVLDMNDGEVGSGVTLGYAGLNIDRGISNNYWLGFDEVRNGFSIGEITALSAPQIATTQLVATREDSPIDNAIPTWDTATGKFITSSTLTYVDGATSTLSVNANTDSSFIIGRARIDSRYTGFAYFSHYSLDSTTNYALTQGSNGNTVLNAKTGSAVYLAIQNVAQWTLSDDGNLTGSAGNTLTVAPDEDITTILGRLVISSPTSDYATLSHYNMANATDYALNQSSTGSTILNAKSTGVIYFAHGNAWDWYISTGGNLIGQTGNTLTVDGAITGTTINGVAITDAGSAGDYLDATGNYVTIAVGNVTALGTFTDNTIMRGNGTTSVQDSGVSISDTNVITGATSITITEAAGNASMSSALFLATAGLTSTSSYIQARNSVTSEYIEMRSHGSSVAGVGMTGINLASTSELATSIDLSIYTKASKTIQFGTNSTLSATIDTSQNWDWGTHNLTSSGQLDIGNIITTGNIAITGGGQLSVLSGVVIGTTLSTIAAPIALHRNATAENDIIGEIYGIWNGNNVTNIQSRSGDDLINKDNGKLAFMTSSAGTPIDALLLDSDQSATFAGAVGMGALTATTGIFSGLLTASDRVYLNNGESDISEMDTVAELDANYLLGTYNGYWGLRQGTDHSLSWDSYNTANDALNVFKLSQAGNATFAGTLESGAITSTGVLNVDGGALTTNPVAIFSADTYALVEIDRGAEAASAGVVYKDIGSARWFVGIAESTDDFNFYNHSAASSLLTIANTTGNATFTGTINSGAITSTGNLALTGGSTIYIERSGAATQNATFSQDGNGLNIDITAASGLFNVSVDGGTTEHFKLVNAGGGVANATFTGNIAMMGKKSIEWNYATLSETGSELATILGNNIKASATDAQVEISNNLTDSPQWLMLNYVTGLSYHKAASGAVGTQYGSGTNKKFGVDLSGNGYFAGTIDSGAITSTGSLTASNVFSSSGIIESLTSRHRGSIQVLNKAASGWLSMFTRNTTGSEVVYDANYLGTINSGAITSTGLITGVTGLFNPTVNNTGITITSAVRSQLNIITTVNNEEVATSWQDTGGTAREWKAGISLAVAKDFTIRDNTTGVNALTLASITGNATFAGTLKGSRYQRSDHHTGYLEGSYQTVAGNEAKTNPVYCIGSTYAPTSATAITNMYGIGYTTGSATFIGSTDLGFTPSSGNWGMYLADNGLAKIFLNASSGQLFLGGSAYIKGGVVIGVGASGGDLGTGSLNVENGIYDNNTINTDYVFEDVFRKGGIIDKDKHSDYVLKSFTDELAFVKENYHLSTIIGRKEWEEDKKKTDLASLVNNIWQTVETQFLYHADHVEQTATKFETQTEQIARLEKRVLELEKEE